MDKTRAWPPLFCSEVNNEWYSQLEKPVTARKTLFTCEVFTSDNILIYWTSFPGLFPLSKSGNEVALEVVSVNLAISWLGSEVRARFWSLVVVFVRNPLCRCWNSFQVLINSSSIHSSTTRHLTSAAWREPPNRYQNFQIPRKTQSNPLFCTFMRTLH